MKVTKCPVCGRLPKIKECSPHNGIRRRMCLCPNYDSIIPSFSQHYYKSWFIYFGDGDDNAILKLWNLAINRYNENKRKDYFDMDFSPWANDIHLEKE